MSTPTFSNGHLLANRYRIERLLGVGHTAEVYVAEDTSLQRDVVVKVLLADLAAQPAIRDAFKNNIVRAAALSHPHVARIFDGGHDHGSIYVVTEYLAHGSVESRLRAGELLSVANAATLGENVAGALAYLHQNGFVHGSLSPRKLLFDAEGHVKVSDISLAGLRDNVRPAYALEEARYVSPEQAQGRAAGPKSDVYSLALILFETITGDPAYDGYTTHDVLNARLSNPIPVRVELGSLDMVLAQATVPNPDLRIDADAFENRLAGVVDVVPSFVSPEATISFEDDFLVEEFEPGDDSTIEEAFVMDEEVAFDNAFGLTEESMTFLPTATERDTIGFRAPSAAQVSGRGPVMVPVPESDDEFAAFANEEVTTLQRGAGLQPRNLTRPERGEHARPSQTVLSGGGRWRVVVGVVLALIIAGAAGAYALGMFGSSAAVPSLVGDTVTQATTALQTAGFSLSVGTPENSATVPSGEIVSQSPKGGSSASSGSAVTVVVSAGPAMVNIPTSVIGESCAKATSKLRAAGFSVTCPASNAIASKAVKKGDVVEVLDGTTVNPASAPKGAALTLALSTGKAPVATTTTTVKNGKTVPSFVGLNESQVNALSASSGFYYHAESSAGVTMHGWTIVVSQSPKAGSVAAAGSTVTLIVR